MNTNLYIAVPLINLMPKKNSNNYKRDTFSYYLRIDLNKEFLDLCEKKRIKASRILEDLLLEWIEKNKEGDNAS
ncbi:MAG: hypothetical protein AABY22_05620 [Nanoarchaeota archaeon]